MGSLAQTLDLAVAETEQVEINLNQAVAQTIPLTCNLDLAAAVPYLSSAQLDTLIGPILRNQLDMAVANMAALPLSTDILVGPACFANMNLHAGAVGLPVPVLLDMAVANTAAIVTDLNGLVAMPRTDAICLCIAVAEPLSIYSCLSVTVCDEIGLRYIQPDLSVLVAETRALCPLDVDVSVGTGVSIASVLNMLVQGMVEKATNLSINVLSPDLQIGASAIYNPDGDTVESDLFVEDAGTYHPEWIQTMTATLLYRDQHDLGSVTFDETYATDDGDVRSRWLHPAHCDQLSIRYQGTIYNLGDVTLEVPVSQDEGAQTTFTPQTLRGVDGVLPRTEWSTYQAHTRQLDPAPTEVDVLDTNVQLVLLHVDLTNEPSMLVGEGSIHYSGGGNRLLPSLDNDGTFVFQSKNVLPVELGGYTLLEGAGSNLLANSDFSLTGGTVDLPVPTGWTLSASNTITTFTALAAHAGGVNVFEIRAIGSGPYVGPKSLYFSYENPIPVTGPVTFSALGRIEFSDRTYCDIPESGVKVDTLELVVQFLDGGGSEISQQVATYAPIDIKGDTFVLLHNPVPSPPIGTVAIQVWFHMESIEASDDIRLYLMAPQVESSSIATSRIVGETAPLSRTVDVLRIPLNRNIEYRRGSVVLELGASYRGTPMADACMFDTRVGGQNGLALYHLANGKLRFIVAGAATSKTLESGAVSFGLGEAQTVAVSWDESLMSIWLNGTEEAEDTTAVLLPQLVGEWMYLFSTAVGTDRFDGQLTTVQIERDIQS